MRRLETRLIGTRADAMRHLVEAVAQRLRTDLDRLKQDVMFWVARHTLVLWLRSGVYLGRTRLLRARNSYHILVRRAVARRPPRRRGGGERGGCAGIASK